MCILLPKQVQLKEVQRQPLPEKCYPPYQCLPLLPLALALLTRTVLGEQSWRGKPVVLLGERPGNLGASTQLGWLWATWSEPLCSKTQQTELFVQEGEASRWGCSPPSSSF